MSLPQLPEGRPGNLTPEQEEKLRKMWEAIFQVCGTIDTTDTSATEASASQAETETPKKKRFGMFRKKDSKSGISTPLSPDASGNNADEDDKYGQNKQFQEALSRQTPEEIRDTIWSMVKHDHPDALALRFLRARKWDVDRALVMMVSTMNWRHTEMHVDDDIMFEGEAGSLADSRGEGKKSKKSGEDFMEQLRLGKSFLHNVDKFGRPICTVRVRFHKQGDQSEESLERYTVYIIETARMLLEPPVDTATIIFDMTGFSMANMDYAPVKFMIKCFEANFPESLGTVLVHNSPWLFQGIWKVIRGWLDPVVAGKVHFTNTVADLKEFIDADKISKELGGDEDWEYQYIEPKEGENDIMKDTETRDKIKAARDELVKQFETATVDWIKTTNPEEAQALKVKRHDLAKQLKENYWKLDPYVRARSLYDRVGNIRPGGIVCWDKTPAPTVSTTAPATTPAPTVTPARETSQDDVD
ncbi:SEC14 [Geosmithia morbida]|uniref:SEC14 n=1 Tax=Geosmithia morbida TaxID=1094350 RepID=A0A9P4YV79_9HYPO|nr:SEC14 [Geosmithia morbida]KAF4121604.1 SEC14 [Geosmithia morbida]